MGHFGSVSEQDSECMRTLTIALVLAARSFELTANETSLAIPGFMPAEGSSPAQVLGGQTSYPMMAASSAGLVVAWTPGPRDRSTIGVRVVK